MIKILKTILRPIRMIKARVAYDRAVQIADGQFFKTHQRHYVIKAAGRRLMVVNRDDFRMLKKKHILNRHANVMSLEQHAVYHTGYNNGTGIMPAEIKEQRKKEIIKWLAD